MPITRRWRNDTAVDSASWAQLTAELIKPDVRLAGLEGENTMRSGYPPIRRVKVIDDRFEAGMVFAFNIDLLDPNWRQGKTGCAFAETIEIMPTGARRMHSFPTEFQRVLN